MNQLAAWLRLLLLATLVAACGDGDGGPAPVSLTAVTVTGMPAQPLAPMQTAQLGAQAAYSDGSVRDVTAAAAWGTTDADVLTVSSTGLATATGPGQAEVVASLGTVSGRAALAVVALPAAYFIDGVEYAFEYELMRKGALSTTGSCSGRESLMPMRQSVMQTLLSAMEASRASTRARDRRVVNFPPG